MRALTADIGNWLRVFPFWLARISPVTSFNQIITDLAWTGESTRKKFINSAKGYQAVLDQALFKFIYRDVLPSGGVSMGMTKMVNMAELPVFNYSLVTLPESFSSITFDIILLILFTTLIFLLLYVSFIKYDVR